ncbi:ShuX-like protein [Escherichia coli]|uniref:ShuX-like protein n=1 Tax=Escherichia coli TaxID=562 RepID=A0A376VB19_ECOLX|nr:ShuX-like protein [Escherichia coli]
MLKIFLGRDDHRQLLSEQVNAFHALAASLKEQPDDAVATLWRRRKRCGCQNA